MGCLSKKNDDVHAKALLLLCGFILLCRQNGVN